MEKTKSVSFGKYLKTVRLEKGIKLPDISRQTKISTDTLELIEAEDHARLPAEVFVKGFLRAYARVVGADGNVAVEGFLESRCHLDESLRFETDAARSKSKSGVRLLTLLGILVVIIAAALLFRQATIPVKTDKQAESVKTPGPIVVKAAAGVVKETARPVQAAIEAKPDQQDGIKAKPVQDTMQAAPAMPAEPLKVEPADEDTVAKPDEPTETSVPENVGPRVKQHISIQVVEETWLKVIVDSSTTNEYSLKAGDTLELDADQGFNLLVGNATGVRLTFNGQSVVVPGKSGQVVTIQLP